MLSIHRRSKRQSIASTITILLSIFVLITGLYLLSLALSPMVIPLIAHTEIDTKTLAKPELNRQQIIIPKIGVMVDYAPGESALDKGAQWRRPENGNPERGGNFIIAAHRLSIQPTPHATIEKSPFYNINKLAIGDTILVDYLGKRYSYTIQKIFNVKPEQVEIEDESIDPILTLYSCDLTGAATGRVVIIAEPTDRSTYPEIN